MTSPPSSWPKAPLDDLHGYSLCPRDYSLYRDRDNNSNHNRPPKPSSRWSSDRGTSSDGDSTNMTTTAPFEVPKTWQTAMSMVSVNAGLFPQEILTQYQRQQPLQKLQRPGYTELDMTGSKRANSRGTKAVTIRYAENDPANIYLMVIFVDEIDPKTKRDIVRLITNTSIKHVLEAEPAANCPLWLRVHSDVTHASSPYQIIPCCERWIEDLDFQRPISNEEKRVHGVVERLMQEVRRRDLLLGAKDREIQDRDDELARLRNHARLGDEVVITPSDNVSYQPAFDIETMIQQYWLVGVIILAILIVVFALK